MTQSPEARPRLDVRGAVDLSGLGRAPAPPPGGPNPATGGAVVDVADEAAFGEVVQRSVEVPVVFVLWAAWSEASSGTVRDLVALAAEMEGKFLLARVDAEALPQVAQAFGAQTVPTVVAVLKGQPVPLFQGAAALEEVRGVLDQLLQAAAANGVTGRVGVDPAPEEDAEPEEPLPPLHQEAFDAIEREDLAGAADAYDRALAENPRDDEARAGLAQVELLRRVQDVDLAAARRAAADAPHDVRAQMVVADLDLAGGKVEDAFSRLLDVVRSTRGEEREAVRARLVELFLVVGDADERVMLARRSLASALY
ncbi:tetratricopeptide repeat protein [Cellulomonas bogoriensis]|uniref:Thioredoxin n=1 Tax=Cellulomonas bogoriensis 69B4 = DSM 16987 TaxID=1386082 RepID=A0A0A0C0U6_9CELL|nr:tetratricopeptide repeat protein [Cellulomonas bogoriensis]KGM13592.1 thioredoxin [Cellulomonas bogoriensis 69B4 = DSM 16987]